MSIKRINIFLFVLAVFFIPFNSYEGVSFLGEFSRESSVLFLLVGIIFLFIEVFLKRAIYLPQTNISKCILYFSLILFFSYVINIYQLHDFFYKKTSGHARFFRQYIAYFMSAFLFYYFYLNVFRNFEIQKLFLFIRKIFFYSFCVVAVYGLIEILYFISNQTVFFIVLKSFDYLPFVEHGFDGQNRIHSVSFEAPALGTFLITTCGWIFSYIKTSRSKLKYLPTIAVLILTYYSGSRTAMVVVLLQFFIFIYFSFNKKEKTYIFSSLIGLMLLFVIVLSVTNSERVTKDITKKIESLDFKSNLKKSISNKSRFGIQYANLKVFSENPFFGVGWGQQGFHAIEHYPYWAKVDNWEFKYNYLNKNETNFPPSYNMFIRILAETGLVGFLMFCFFIYNIYKSLKLIYNRIENKQIAIVLIISFFGLFMNFFQLDTFRVFGLWLFLAFLTHTLIKLKNNEETA